MEVYMAGFAPKDIMVARGDDENTLKDLIIEAWEMMRKVNWDERHYCVFNPKGRIFYPIAKNFKSFYDGEGWNIDIVDEPTNIKFNIYLNQTL
jgi:hypothetical protein